MLTKSNDFAMYPKFLKPIFALGSKYKYWQSHVEVNVKTLILYRWQNKKPWKLLPKEENLMKGNLITFKSYSMQRTHRN
jgi:hypothetical protein